MNLHASVVAPIAFPIAVISLDGPIMNEVPVSTIAWHSPLQKDVVESEDFMFPLK